MAARPGSGKTALLVQIASYAAQHNDGTVVLFSLELDKQAISERLLACDAQVNSEYLRNGHHSADDAQVMIQSLERLGNTGLHIDDTPSPTTLQIASVCRRHAMRGPLALVVVDYLGRITPADTRVALYQQISRISNELKTLARELQVPVICAAQLNREVEKRQDGPRLSDLRDSGSIEQDADSVLFLYPSPKRQGVTEAILAKNRYGRTERSSWSSAKTWPGSNRLLGFSKARRLAPVDSNRRSAIAHLAKHAARFGLAVVAASGRVAVSRAVSRSAGVASAQRRLRRQCTGDRSGKTCQTGPDDQNPSRGTDRRFWRDCAHKDKE